MDAQPVAIPPASFGERFLAYAIDTVPFCAGATATVAAWSGIFAHPATPHFLIANGALWLFLAAAWQFFGNLSGATPGKRLLGLRVVSLDGGPLGARRSFIRAIVWILGTPLANFGFLLALFSPRTRALHDFAAGTAVVGGGSLARGLSSVSASVLVVALFGLQIWLGFLLPTKADVEKFTLARQGMEVVAQLQTKYKAAHGVYANSMGELAQADGDPAHFSATMLRYFSPAPFIVEGGNRRWRVTAAARDARRTILKRSGP